MSDESGKLIDSSSFLHIDHQKKNSQNRMLMVPVFQNGIILDICPPPKAFSILFFFPFFVSG